MRFFASRVDELLVIPNSHVVPTAIAGVIDTVLMVIALAISFASMQIVEMH